MSKLNIKKMIMVVSMVVGMIAVALPTCAMAEENIDCDMTITIPGIIDSPCNIYSFSHKSPLADFEMLEVVKPVDGYTPKLSQAAMEGTTGLKGSVYIKGASSGYSCSFSDAQIVEDIISTIDKPDGTFEVIETFTIKTPRTKWISH